jgi:O-antigen ligase
VTVPRLPQRPAFAGQSAPPISRPAGPSATVVEERSGGPWKLLLAVWTLALFDPQWWLASLGLQPILRVTTLLFGSLMLVMLLGVPSNPSWSRRWLWYPPFLCFVLSILPMIPFAVNTGFVRTGAKTMFFWWIFITATIAIVPSVRRAETLLKMYGVQFLWFMFWGRWVGVVPWHHSLENHDAFGAFMVGGFTMTFFLGLGAPRGGRFRKLMFLTSFLCVIGVVASYARGAFLATIVVFAVMWARSPRKGMTLLAGVGVMVVVFAAASLIFPAGFFYNEIMSAFAEGTSSGTGDDRWQLWTAAMEVFRRNPIVGAGMGNVGAYASGIYQPGELGGMYAINPMFLYGKALHNIFLTILSEQGIIGFGVFIWLVIDFFRRNAWLRSEHAAVIWSSRGGTLALRPTALGLEVGMVALLLTGMLYPMLNIHWFFSMIALNLLLSQLTRSPRGALSGRARAATARGRSRS